MRAVRWGVLAFGLMVGGTGGAGAETVPTATLAPPPVTRVTVDPVHGRYSLQNAVTLTGRVLGLEDKFTLRPTVAPPVVRVDNGVDVAVPNVLPPVLGCEGDACSQTEARTNRLYQLGPMAFDRPGQYKIQVELPGGTQTTTFTIDASYPWGLAWFIILFASLIGWWINEWQLKGRASFAAQALIADTRERAQSLRPKGPVAAYLASPIAAFQRDLAELQSRRELGQVPVAEVATALAPFKLRASHMAALDDRAPALEAYKDGLPEPVAIAVRAYVMTLVDGDATAPEDRARLLTAIDTAIVANPVQAEQRRAMARDMAVRNIGEEVDTVAGEGQEGKEGEDEQEDKPGDGQQQPASPPKIIPHPVLSGNLFMPSTTASRAQLVAQAWSIDIAVSVVSAVIVASAGAELLWGRTSTWGSLADLLSAGAFGLAIGFGTGVTWQTVVGDRLKPKTT